VEHLSENNAARWLDLRCRSGRRLRCVDLLARISLTLRRGR